MIAKNKKIIFVLVSSSVDALAPSQGDIRYFVADSKCEGIGCAYAPSCGRFVRKEQENQPWASFYALDEDDCQYFEPVLKGINHANS